MVRPAPPARPSTVGGPYHPGVAHSETAALLQVLDAQGAPTGEARPASEVHAAGLWHAAVVVWVLRADGGVLLRRAPPDDPCAPLRLGPSAHAHVVGPDVPAAQAAAALERRLSVTALRDGLAHLGTFATERPCRGGVDREVQEVFAARDDTPLGELALDPTTVDTVYEVPLARALALFDCGAYVPAPGFDAMQRVSNALLVAEDLPEHGREALLEQLRALDAWVSASEALRRA